MNNIKENIEQQLSKISLLYNKLEEKNKVFEKYSEYCPLYLVKKLEEYIEKAKKLDVEGECCVCLEDKKVIRIMID